MLLLCGWRIGDSMGVDDERCGRACSCPCLLSDFSSSLEQNDRVTASQNRSDLLLSREQEHQLPFEGAVFLKHGFSLLGCQPLLADGVVDDSKFFILYHVNSPHLHPSLFRTAHKGQYVVCAK